MFGNLPPAPPSRNRLFHGELIFHRPGSLNVPGDLTGPGDVVLGAHPSGEYYHSVSGLYPDIERLQGLVGLEGGFYVGGKGHIGRVG